MALKLLWLLNLCTKYTLHNDCPEGRRVFTTKYIAALSGVVVFYILNVGGADVPIFCSNVCPLTWAILLRMAKSLAAVALNAGRASRRGNGGGALG